MGVTRPVPNARVTLPGYARGVTCTSFVRGWPSAVLAALWLVGCRYDHFAANPPLVSADADAWSGGTVVLRSRSFVGPDSLPTVTIVAQALPVRSFDADSVSVGMPDTDGSPDARP